VAHGVVEHVGGLDHILQRLTWRQLAAEGQPQVIDRGLAVDPECHWEAMTAPCLEGADRAPITA